MPPFCTDVKVSFIAALLLLAAGQFTQPAAAEYRKCGNVYVWFPIDQYGQPQVPAAAAGAYDPKADEPLGAFRGISPCKCAEALMGAVYVPYESAETRGGTTEAEFSEKLRWCPGSVKTLLRKRYQLTKEQYELGHPTDDAGNRRANELIVQEREIKKEIARALLQVCDRVGSPDYRDKLLPYNPNWDKLQGSVDQTAKQEDPESAKDPRTPLIPGGTGTTVIDTGVPRNDIFGTPQIPKIAPNAEVFRPSVSQTDRWKCFTISWADWQRRVSNAALSGLEAYLKQFPVGTDVMIHAIIAEDGTVLNADATLLSQTGEGAARILAERVRSNLMHRKSDLIFPEMSLRTAQHPNLRHQINYALRWTRYDAPDFTHTHFDHRDLDEIAEFPPGMPAPINAHDCPNHPAPANNGRSQSQQVPSYIQQFYQPQPTNPQQWRPQKKFNTDNGIPNIPGRPGLGQKRF